MKTLEMVIVIEAGVALAMAMGLLALMYDERWQATKGTYDVWRHEDPAPAATDAPAGAERER
jgi:hypothetical protein